MAKSVVSKLVPITLPVTGRPKAGTAGDRAEFHLSAQVLVADRCACSGVVSFVATKGTKRECRALEL